MGLRDKLRLERRHGNNHSSPQHHHVSLSPSPTAMYRSQFGGSPISGEYETRSVISQESASTPTTVTTGLGRFVNVAFCGYKGVGKSRLINSICQKHVANERGREHHIDGNRYIHPTIDEVALYEMPTEYTARKDFKGFHLVVIVINGSVRKLDMETAFRAYECDVPVIFVHTRADQLVERLLKLGNSRDTATIREIVNKNADKGWYQQKEKHKKVYIVSCPALERREGCQFDEVELLRRIEPCFNKYANAHTRNGSLHSGLNSVHVDEMTNSLTQESFPIRSPVQWSARNLYQSSPVSTAKSYTGGLSVRSFGGSQANASPTMTPASPSLPHSQVALPSLKSSPVIVPSKKSSPTDSCMSAPAASRLSSSMNFGGTSSAVPHASLPESIKSSRSKAPKSARIAFLEQIDPASTTPTLMESFLGFIAGTDRTIVQNTPYKHPEYPGAVFYSIAATRNGKQVQGFIDMSKLSLMRLVVLVFSSILKDWDFNLIKELRRFGVDVICCHNKVDDHVGERSFSPRRTYRKLKELTHSSTRKVLNKNSLGAIPVFTVNPRILRMPDSFPKSDEEDFKDYIASICGGRTIASGPSPYGRGFGSPGEISRRTYGDVSTLPSASPLSGRMGRSTRLNSGLSSQASFVSHRMSRSLGPPKSALMNGSTRNSPFSPKGSSNSVTFLCRQQVLVAVVGQQGCGKSTLIRNAIGLKSSNDQQKNNTFKGCKSIRHPAFYDLIFQDYPGYDVLDPSIGTERWIHQNKIQDVDWIIIVFQVALSRADVAIAQYAEQNQIPVVFVATKCDLCVDAFIYDKNMVEKAAVEHTRFSIVQSYRSELEQNDLSSIPLYLVSGRIIERKSRYNINNFDEDRFLQLIESDIAGTLK